MGSKAKYAKYILPIILKDRRSDQFYIEPFMGGCNTLYQVTGNRIGNDINEYLVELFRAVQNGYVPPDYVTEEEYKHIRENKESYPKHVVGFVGFGCSYSGKFFAGFARNVRKNAPDSEILNKTTRNYCAESKRNILRQTEGIKDIIFLNKNYWELDIPERSLLYLDPPYFSTTKYSNKFDHDKFWQWCGAMVNNGHKVFVSEYNAPENWKCVWEKKVFSSLTKETGSKIAIERLFTIDKNQ